MARKWVIGSSVILLGAGLGLLIYARREKSQVKDAPAAEHPVGPTAKKVPDSILPLAKSFLGVIVSPQAVDVEARLDARLAELKVRVGDRVAKDAPIAVLDVRVQQGDLTVAQAVLKASQAAENKARIELAQAHDKVERSTKISNVISAEELSTDKYQERLAASQLESARANVSESQARVAQLEVELQDATVRAPFDGVVATTYVDPGALLHPQSMIVRLISGDRLWVRFAVPEEQARALTLGANVKVSVPTLSAEFTGQIESVAPEVDPAARMIFSEAKLTIPDEWKTRVPAGSVARVELTKI